MLVVRSATSRARFVNLRDSPVPGAHARGDGLLSANLEFIHETRGSERGTMLSIKNNPLGKAPSGWKYRRRGASAVDAPSLAQ